MSPTDTRYPSGWAWPLRARAYHYYYDGQKLCDPTRSLLHLHALDPTCHKADACQKCWKRADALGLAMEPTQ